MIFNLFKKILVAITFLFEFIQKKWFSYFRGENCFMVESNVKHILDNLQSILMIRWNPLSIKILKPNTPFPNPDNLTKVDMVNIIHDLTYHTRNIFGDKDMISVLEEKEDKSLIELDKQSLLYYVYLFSFIVYSSKFLNEIDFEKFLVNNTPKFEHYMKQPASKVNFIEFIVYLSRIVPSKPESSIQKIKNWVNEFILGLMNLFKVISVKETIEVIKKYTGFSYTDEIEEEAKKLLNDWKVKKYSESSYLMKIPEKQIVEKYESIRRSLGLARRYR